MIRPRHHRRPSSSLWGPPASQWRSDIYEREENRGDGKPPADIDIQREGWGGHWDDAPFRPEDLWPDEDNEEVEEPDEYPPGEFIETLRGSGFDVELRRHLDEQ